MASERGIRGGVARGGGGVEKKTGEKKLPKAEHPKQVFSADHTAELRERVAVTQRAEESLRILTARLLNLQDEERRRFARELHDSAGQLLTAMSMSLSVVEREAAKLSSKAAGALSDANNLLQETLREIRTISHLMHPPLLDEAGLTSAIRWYAEGFAERSKIKVILNLAEDFGRLPREMETALFRIVQESLTNIHRHSESEVAKISLTLSLKHALLYIEDEGKGIPAQKLWEMQVESLRGVGLPGMRERVRQLGGEFELTSDSDGTRLSVKFPLPA